MIPLIGLGVSNVDTSKVAAAAGMSNFVRTLSGAFSTSITTAIWSNQATRDNAELVGSLHKPETVIDALVHGGMRHATATSELASMVQSQSIMLATNQVFAGVAVILLLSAWVIWLTPRSTRTVDVTAGH
jgi:DHA2 family multidrug resistance protein